MATLQEQMNHFTTCYKYQDLSLPASCPSETMMKRRHFYVMEWMFCELEIYSSPLNSSLQQTCSNDLVLLSLMYKKPRDSLLHPSVSQFTDSQRGIQSQLNCTLIKKNVRLNEYTLAPKQLCSKQICWQSLFNPTSPSFFTSLHNNDWVQTQIHFSAFSQKTKAVLYYFQSPYVKASGIYSNSQAKFTNLWQGLLFHLALYQNIIK